MNWNNTTLLDIVEYYAEENCLIASEEELSKRFDEQILPGIIETYGEKGKAFTDTDMINESFNNWSDSLEKEGELHEEQYNKYEYVGRLSE